MSNYDDAYDSYKQVHHEGKLSHELLAGAASFGAIHEWEKRQRESGEPVKHGVAKEIIGGIAAAEVEKLFETKGLDAWDKHKLKEQAEENAKNLYDQQYGNQPQYDPNYPPNENVEHHHRHHHGGW
ncbi:hypothetical protein TWF173_003626 [Orbilia oligospora]|uniref:CipC-like antibiotic response protein n=2 Tax=Orbilia oligospora TaxID=2813651 RepID=G1X5R6_ARTOA|nr:hypothetical protein AOL_s00054g210 [Orbilia oligospora ATCC 24927]EGX51511.1 hypothetical protein AOL_s00054g210 [Orbilia oligospora ATCC 24927]KAF3281485.1 hypothetical protein TWF970_002046 [Orbilia oligospora]KAF3319175.1 hypothetical protein TWF173_003626 [Orbilia oligospora]